MIVWLKEFLLAPPDAKLGNEHRRRWKREDGQTFVEYALLLAFIAAVALAAVQLLGVDISSVFNHVANSF